jgi:hypothetical protein
VDRVGELLVEERGEGRVEHWADDADRASVKRGYLRAQNGSSGAVREDDRVPDDAAADETPEQMRQREWAESSGLPWDAPRTANDPFLPMVGREAAWRDRQLGKNVAALSTRTQLTVLAVIVAAFTTLYLVLRFS